MHNGILLLKQCKAFLNMQTLCIKGKPFQGLMAVPNKGALTLNTPKVSDGKRNPDASVCRQMGFNGPSAQAANDPEP